MTSGQDGLNLLLKLFGGRIAQYQHVPDVVKLETISGKVTVRAFEDEVLGLEIGLACGVLAGKACCLIVGKRF